MVCSPVPLGSRVHDVARLAADRPGLVDEEIVLCAAEEAGLDLEVVANAEGASVPLERRLRCLLRRA